MSKSAKFGVVASGRVVERFSRPPVGNWAIGSIGGTKLVVSPSGSVLLNGKSISHHAVARQFGPMSGCKCPSCNVVEICQTDA